MAILALLGFIHDWQQMLRLRSSHALALSFRGSRGFTLVELVVVVAIAVVLASLVVAAYQTFTVRSQVDEAVSLATVVKARIIEVYEQSGSLPAGRLEAGLSPDPTDAQASYVAAIDVINGRIDITFGHEAHPDISTATLSLTPYSVGDEVIWRCGRAREPDGAPITDGVNSTEYEPGNIDPRYLPSSCR